jgi:acetolactate decarboxylase
MRMIPIAVATWIAIAGGTALAAEAPPTLFQYSTMNALLQGVYDGEMTVCELARHGGFGLGTLNGLDGEMVAIDGAFYQVRVDGRAYPIAPESETPFAVVTRFAPGTALPLPEGLDYAGLLADLDRRIANPNIFAAIRIDGTFPEVKVRSVPAQSAPYRPLAEVIEDQAVFDLKNVHGTLVGIRMPAYMADLNVPGYHFHFLTEDRGRGGHVLALVTESGTIEIDEIGTFEIKLPDSADFAAANLTGERADEMDKVERARE